MSNIERTGWRDQALSDKIRGWGIGCSDIDFLTVQYGTKKNLTALIDFKHENARIIDYKSHGYQALSLLASNTGLPFFQIKYDLGRDWWTVMPINAEAFQVLSRNIIFNEWRLIAFLQELKAGRKTEPEGGWARRISNP